MPCGVLWFWVREWCVMCELHTGPENTVEGCRDWALNSYPSLIRRSLLLQEAAGVGDQVIHWVMETGGQGRSLSWRQIFHESYCEVGVPPLEPPKELIHVPKHPFLSSTSPSISSLLSPTHQRGKRGGKWNLIPSFPFPHYMPLQATDKPWARNSREVGSESFILDWTGHNNCSLLESSEIWSRC